MASWPSARFDPGEIMRGRMWLLGALHLTTGCNMYDGALLFARQPVAAATPSTPDAGAYNRVATMPDAGHAQMLDADGGGAGPSEVLEELAGRAATPMAAGRGGTGGFAEAGGTGGSVGAGMGGAGTGTGTSTGGAGGVGGAVADPRCSEEGARLWAENGHCYIPVELAQSWNLSRDRCGQLGGQLVTITSAQEQAFVATVGAGTSRWLGLSRFGAAMFSWISGESLSYTRWQAGAPALNGEAAVLMRGDTQEWMDATIASTHPALCERE